MVTLIGLGFMFMAGFKLANKDNWALAYGLISIVIFFH